MPRSSSEDWEDAKALKGEEEDVPAIVEKAMQYCWSNGFLDVFRKYFRDHASEFVGYPPKRDMESAEHSLVHWDLFQNYLKLYERTLCDWLESEGVAEPEFYDDVRRTQKTSSDPKVQEFVYCLLASCDYDSFYAVMVREAMKLSKRVVPDVAEAKSSVEDEEGKSCTEK